MLRSHLLIALRMIWRQKLYAGINILGLAVGMTCAVLILLWVEYEQSYDRFHEDADRIFRIVSRNLMPQATEEYINIAPQPLVWHLKNDFPEVASAARVAHDNTLIRFGEESYGNERIVYADPDFLEVFTFPIVRGDSVHALAEPYTALITQATARRLFGELDPLGQTLTLGTVFDFTVTAVLADIPAESHLQFDYLISMATRRDYWHEDAGTSAFMIGGRTLSPWSRLSGQLYFRLRPDADPTALEQKLTSFVAAQYEDMRWEGMAVKMQPLTTIHMTAGTVGEFSEGSDARYVYFVTALAILILVIACLNYMNLATARSLQRAREVGVRKVLGADRLHLMRQFLAEAILMSVIAMALAAGLTELALPVVGDLIRAAPMGGLLGSPARGLGALGVAVLVGLVSGSYPALYLSRFRPAVIFHRHATSGTAGSRSFRRGLVTAQYAIAIGLTVCALIVYRQLQYIRDVDLGYRTANIVGVEIRDFRLLGSFESFKKDLLACPDIVDLAAAESFPDSRGGGSGGCWWEGKSDDDLDFPINFTSVDANYVDFYGMTLVEGESFSGMDPAPGQALWILNEAAVRRMGKESMIGRGFGLSAEHPGTVVGVVKDYHNTSLHQPIQPMALQLDQGMLHSISLMLTPHGAENALRHARVVFEKHSRFPFEYWFLDDHIAAQYAGEQRLWRVFRLSAVLALFVSCLGVLGLASFAAESRTREIGIRKVMGAGMTRIIALLSGDFARWVLLANLLAWPMAYWGMSRWLERFVYRASVGWEWYLLAGGAAVLLAVATVSLQAVRAARANPVESLRHE